MLSFCNLEVPNFIKESVIKEFTMNLKIFIYIYKIKNSYKFFCKKL